MIYTLDQLAAAVATHKQAIDQLQAERNGANAQLRQVLDANHRVEQELNAFRQQQMQGLGSDSPQVQKQLKQLEDAFSEFQQKVNFDASSLARPRTIDDVPGIRTPRWYTVEIDFEGGVTTRTNNTINIDPAGPFVITQMQAMWQCTDADINPAGLLGRVLPVSGYALLVANGGQTAVGTIITNLLLEIPELSFEVEIAGSGRFWTNQKLYGPAFYGNYAPLYLGTMGWVDKTDSIRTWCTPEIATPHDGTAIVTYHGFQILTSLSISQLLGFAQ